MTLVLNPSETDRRGRRCIDVMCDKCGVLYVSGTGSPTLAACHAEVAGWVGQGYRGMYCPRCAERATA